MNLIPALPLTSSALVMDKPFKVDSCVWSSASPVPPGYSEIIPASTLTGVASTTKTMVVPVNYPFMGVLTFLPRPSASESTTLTPSGTGCSGFVKTYDVSGNVIKTYQYSGASGVVTIDLSGCVYIEVSLTLPGGYNGSANLSGLGVRTPFLGF